MNKENICLRLDKELILALQNKAKANYASIQTEIKKAIIKYVLECDK